MSSEGRRAYEREAYEEARTQLERVTARPHEIWRLRDMKLEGEYPETRIVARVWNEGLEREYVRTHWLWRNPQTGRPDEGRRSGAPESPYTVGMLFTTRALGG